MATAKSGPDSELSAILARRKEMASIQRGVAPPKPKGANTELAAMLERRAKLAEPERVLPTDNIGQRPAQRTFNATLEFSEFTRKEINEYTNTFRTYDQDKSGTLNIEELKKMMEKLGHPQTHTALFAMIREVDEDRDGEISMREFFTIFRRARAGDLKSCEGLQAMATSVNSVDVSEVGVGGAKSFFEAKANELLRSKEAESEIKAEQEGRKAAKQEAVQRKIDFKERLNKFNQAGK